MQTGANSRRTCVRGRHAYARGRQTLVRGATGLRNSPARWRGVAKCIKRAASAFKISSTHSIWLRNITMPRKMKISSETVSGARKSIFRPNYCCVPQRPSAQVCLHIASVCRPIASVCRPMVLVCRPIAHHVSLLRPSAQVCLHIAWVCRPIASVCHPLASACRPIAQWCLSDAVSFEFRAIDSTTQQGGNDTI